MEEKREPVPALFEHCVQVYDAMADNATMDYPRPDDTDKALVYEGFLTKLITEDLNFSVPYYSKISYRLKSMGCIEQVRRGGSTTKSRWLLIEKPTLDNFGRVVPQTKKRMTRLDTLEQQVRDLNERMNRAGL